MSFTLTGQNFTIGPYDYILEVQGSCISSFFGMGKSTSSSIYSIQLTCQLQTSLSLSARWQFLVMPFCGNGTPCTILAPIALASLWPRNKACVHEAANFEIGERNMAQCVHWRNGSVGGEP